MTAPGERTDGRSGADHLLFRLGQERFAAPLASVEEALDLPASALQTVPGGPPALRGVFALRGALVPLYTPHLELGTPPTAHATVLVLRPGADGARAALAVDDVDDVLTVGDAELRANPGASSAKHVVRGVVQRGTTIIAVVDLNALVAACRGATGGDSP